MTVPAPRGGLRGTMQRRLWTACLRRCSPLDPPALAASALILAPHPDDETLGCGGTIARKLAAGAELRVAVLSDGTASHARFVAAAELRQRRLRELQQATAALGLPASALHCLDLPDGHLEARLPDAVAALRPLIERFRPRQLFLPCRGDQLPDHLATRAAGLEAARLAGAPLQVYGYPVWFWNHWPWLRRNALGADRPLAALGRFLRGGSALLRDFRVRVDLDEATLARKRAALAMHRSQVERPADQPDWPVLGDVGAGELLRCLLREVEIYSVEELPPA